jgi:hypothetical protein
VSLPWIVLLAALVFFILRQSGLFESGRAPRPPRKHRPEIPERAGERPDRLKIFEEYLRGLGEDDKAGKTDKPEDRDSGG